MAIIPRISRYPNSVEIADIIESLEGVEVVNPLVAAGNSPEVQSLIYDIGDYLVYLDRLLLAKRGN